jgi:hypothetical protein
MKHGKNQLLPVIIIVIIVVISVAAIVSLVRTFFGGSSQNTETAQQQEDGEAALLSTSLDRAVRMTIRGEITADEKFRTYQIVISPNSRTMTTYASYLDQPIETEALDNNVKAYEEFVYALNRGQMMKGEPLEGEKDDTRGLCANGKVIEFETLQNDQRVKRLWTTTCKESRGSFRGNSTKLSNMFLEQIPRGNELLKSINKR